MKKPKRPRKPYRKPRINNDANLADRSTLTTAPGGSGSCTVCAGIYNIQV